MTIIYTSFKFAYALDENMSLIEKAELSHESAQKIENNEWLDEEKELIRKHGKGRIMFLGFKKEKIENIVLTQDIHKLEKAAELVNEKDLHEASIRETKKRIKESVQKDLLIIQASNSIEELNKAANLLAKRLREWYELYNPEFSKAVEDHEKFISIILEKNKTELLKITGISEKESMGAELHHTDVESIMILAKEIKKMLELRDAQKEYLERIMDEYCPNTRMVAGSQIGAKLITLAGSLKRLSELPASTVQVLGAEKALFRHIKTGAKSPKFGAIFNHPLIQTGKRKDAGKIGRALADKIAIAAKVDYFKGKFVGDELLRSLEKKFR